MQRNKKAGMIGIIITIIILIAIVIFSNGDKENSFFENAASNLVMPIQNGLTYLKNKIGGNNTFFTDIGNLKEENKNLKQKNSELEQSLRELENIKTQNETLKEYLNLTEKYGEYKTIPGYVINKDISNYSKTIVINLGNKDGVKENMTVIGDQGLVGHVVSVTENTAKVQTIIDTASSVSCSMSTTKDSIVCKRNLRRNLSPKSHVHSNRSQHHTRRQHRNFWTRRNLSKRNTHRNRKKSNQHPKHDRQICHHRNSR